MALDDSVLAEISFRGEPDPVKRESINHPTGATRREECDKQRDEGLVKVKRGHQSALRSLSAAADRAVGL